MALLGKRTLEDLLGRTCGKVVSRGLEGLVRWSSSHEETMRSARGNVTYAANGHDAGLTVSLIGADQKAVSVSLVEANDREIEKAIEAAAEMLPLVPSNPYLPDLVGPEGVGNNAFADAYDRETAAGAIEIKADFFSRAHRVAALAGFTASARFFTGEGEIAVANTKGLFRYHPFTLASCRLVVAGPHTKPFGVGAGARQDGRSISAHSSHSHASVRKIDGARLIDEGVANARLQARLPFANPFAGGAKDLRYDAILSPVAMAEWLDWFSMCGLHGLAIVEGSSFMTGKVGERVTGERFTLADDWTRPGGIPWPFDAEGRDRQVLPLIEAGIARGVAWDGVTAKKADTVSTGHANASPFGDSTEATGTPLHLVMEGGTIAPEEMVANVSRPTILISYLNYPSMPDSQGAVFTATTRHGTFLVEGGEYVAVLPALRLKEKSLEAFGRIEALSPHELVIPFENYSGVWPVGTLVPWTKIAQLAFIDAVV
ncbi:MAG: metallopeptidase TldD-related protein [bacterium]|nr:metallopeptidase TldD-related protein [bacterium]